MNAYITRGDWTQEIKEKYLLAQKNGLILLRGERLILLKK